MMGHQQVEQAALFYEFSLERHVPTDHLLRSIDRFVELGELRRELSGFYSPIGRPSIAPELMIRMLLVGYCFGIRSERRLCEEIHLNLAYRWFCRLGLDGGVPDHSTFSKNRHGRFRESDLLRRNDPKSNSDYSRIINARTVDRLASLIDPTKVIAGGKSDRDAHYLDPTLLYPVTWDDKIMEDEVFGPILPILTYKSFDEAMTRMAKTGRPLAGFIFSRDQKTIDRFIGQLSFGGGGVNVVNVHLFVETMPFGGTGSAGMGHYYGKYGFDALSHAKSMLISPPDVAIDHLYSPFNDAKNQALKGWFEY